MQRASRGGDDDRRRWLVVASWVAVIVFAAAIFWVSSNTGQDVDEGLGIISVVKDAIASLAIKLFGHEVDVSPVGHFAEYLVFAFLLVNALRFHISLPRAALLGMAIASLYGASDEFHQYFVPGRSSDVFDWVTDTAASALGACLRWLVGRSMPA